MSPSNFGPVKTLVGILMGAFILLFLCGHGVTSLNLKFEDAEATDSDFFEQNPQRVDYSDAYLDSAELILKHGFPMERHLVTTKDRYVLNHFRIPRPGGRPIVLVHGILCSSREFLMQRGNNSLAYMLYNVGYDVWIPNLRGNNHSQGHLEYSTDDPRFWDFSVDEMSDFDVPTTIDYILNVTNQEQLIWVGYSLGATVIFSGLINYPEYQEKLHSFVGIAAVAYKANDRSPIVGALSKFALPEQPLKAAMDELSHGEFAPYMLSVVLQDLAPTFCNQYVDVLDACGGALGLVGGFNSKQVDHEMQPIILGGFPSITSVRTLIQQFQHVFIGAGKFRKYFFQNPLTNLEMYGQLTPPELDLRKFRVPSIIISALNDNLAPPEDVTLLTEDLPRLLFVHNVTDPEWNHLDFVFGKDARSLVYDVMIEQLRIYSPP